MQSVTFILHPVPTTVPEDLNHCIENFTPPPSPPWTLQDNAQYCSMELRVEHNVICDLFHLMVSRNRNRNESANGSTKRGFLLLLLLAMKLEAINATDTALTHSLCTGCNCSRCNKVLHFSPLYPMHSGRRGRKRVKEKSEIDLIEVEYCLSGFNFFTSSVSKPPLHCHKQRHSIRRPRVMSCLWWCLGNSFRFAKCFARFVIFVYLDWSSIEQFLHCLLLMLETTKEDADEHLFGGGSFHLHFLSTLFSVATDNHRYHNNKGRQEVEQDLSVLCYDGIAKRRRSSSIWRTIPH